MDEDHTETVQYVDCDGSCTEPCILYLGDSYLDVMDALPDSALTYAHVECDTDTTGRVIYYAHVAAVDHEEV